MGLIHDMTEKIKAWQPCKPDPPVIIIAEDHADKLICRMCGKRYASRGKWDPGICRDCERAETEKEALLIGGPCDGQKAGDPDDKG